MGWRLAKALVTLREQVNVAYPKRSKLSDGTIGDQAHASRPSDHNPNGAGVVCGLDITHDPANGCDAHALAETLRTHRHPNLKYIISNSRIASSREGWKWRTYSGTNKHNKHIHVSVGVGSDGQSKQPYDDTTPWTIKGGVAMSADALTKEEVTVAHQLIFGVPANPGTYVAWQGKDLSAFLTSVAGSTSTLDSKVKTGKLVPPSAPVTPAPPVVVPPVVSTVECKCDIEDIAEAVFQRLKEQTNK